MGRRDQSSSFNVDGKILLSNPAQDSWVWLIPVMIFRVDDDVSLLLKKPSPGLFLFHFCPFQILIEKSIDVVLGIRTRGR